MKLRLLACAALAALTCAGCSQKIPVSTDPVGATVYLDGQKVCAATPCSVEASTSQAHLLTIVKDGYTQKEVRLSKSPSGNALTPDMVSLKLSKPGELNVRDPDSVIDTAVDVGVEMLKRVLEGDKAR